MKHIVPSYFIQPQHAITVNLIGCGGTGSLLLTKLAQIHHALQAGGLGLGQHLGLHVRAFDGDNVEASNVGRQGFFPADIGQNKAVVLMSRINRAYGLGWDAYGTMYNKGCIAMGLHKANITITCVDSVKAREEVRDMLKTAKKDEHSFEKQWYWLDLGNSKTVGQAILGTILQVKQPKGSTDCVSKLPNVFEVFPDLKKHETQEEQGPSCSVAESLNTQDLCINSMLAEWGKKLIWNIFRQMRLENHGVFVNLDQMIVNPLPIKENVRIQHRKNKSQNRSTQASKGRSAKKSKPTRRRKA